MKTTAKYSHDELPLLVTVDRDADGCVVTSVTVADSAHNIAHLFSKATIDSISDTVDKQLSREARQQNAAARAERHQWHREFCVAAA